MECLVCVISESSWLKLMLLQVQGICFSLPPGVCPDTNHREDVVTSRMRATALLTGVALAIFSHETVLAPEFKFPLPETLTLAVSIFP